MFSSTGIDPALSFSAIDADMCGYRQGDRRMGYDGKEYLFVRYKEAASAAGDVFVVSSDAMEANLLDNTSGAADLGDLIGVARAAVTDEYYGWLQIWGTTTFNAAANCAANAEILSTATGGRIDDATGSGTVPIVGAHLTTAVGGSAAVVAGFLNYPRLGYAAN